ncbi:hypothetical protein ATANTOWER_017613 [Ataeniobius toweri]|uniref:Uncharacterized protein n=1 Tax=Ataeniobius toweri TaxID=208326 RepID=A0ABU7CL99_9TELE|nr:hypothetical protein [Ataeniobius toweri]
MQGIRPPTQHHSHLPHRWPSLEHVHPRNQVANQPRQRDHPAPEKATTILRHNLIANFNTKLYLTSAYLPPIMYYFNCIIENCVKHVLILIFLSAHATSNN